MMMPNPTRLTKIVRKMMRSGRVTRVREFYTVLGSGFLLDRPGSFVVPDRCVIEVREAPSRLVDELGDPRHLVELDLRDLVGLGVIVGVQPGGEKNDRNTLGRIAEVIAAKVQLLGIARIVEVV